MLYVITLINPTDGSTVVADVGLFEGPVASDVNGIWTSGRLRVVRTAEGWSVNHMWGKGRVYKNLIIEAASGGGLWK